MSSLGAVCVQGASAGLHARAEALGIERQRDATPEQWLWIDIGSGFSLFDDALRLARVLSRDELVEQGSPQELAPARQAQGPRKTR